MMWPIIFALILSTAHATLCSPGCLTCLSSDCIRCADLQLAQIDLGACSCIERGMVLDTLGQCGYCLSPGCEICLNSEVHTCSKCIDSSAILKDDICTCQSGYRLNQSNYCDPCEIQGCSSCSAQEQCLQCIDPKATLVNNTCTCASQNGLSKQLNSDGYCGVCWVIGCHTCLAEDPRRCVKCFDSSAVLNPNGTICQCPANHSLSESTKMCTKCSSTSCAGCQKRGCKFCDLQGRCLECIDSNAYVDSEGNCQCFQTNQTINSTGFCEHCEVAGCAACLLGSASTCKTCNSDAFLTPNKSCSCESGDSFDLDTNSCLDCENCTNQCSNIIGCESCLLGQCYKCIDTTAAVIYAGVCVCLPLDDLWVKPNSLGICEPCFVPGCASCVPGKSNLCSKCISTTVKNGLCECSKSFDSSGSCVQWDIGCEIGDSANSSICLACKDQNSNLQEGICTCIASGLTMGSDGYCQPCHVAGCEMCFNMDPQTCVRCHPSSSLIAGRCVCPSQLQFDSAEVCTRPCLPGCLCSNENTTCSSCVDDSFLEFMNGECRCLMTNHRPNIRGVCEACLVAGCRSCQINKQKECRQCLDSTASISNGRCECPFGQWFDISGYCSYCPYGCASCADGLNCSQCVDPRASLVDGECVCTNPGEKPSPEGYCTPCDIPGCASCAEGLSVCMMCLDIDAQLNSEGTACVCPANQTMNEEGECVQFASDCPDPSCLRCNTASKANCYTCQGSKSFIYKGKCECLSSLEKHNPNGICQICNVQGCASCKAGDPQFCSACLDSAATISTGRCLCPSNQAFDSDGFCVACDSARQFQSSTGVIICVLCVDGQYSQQNGTCTCASAGYRANAKGVCELCNVQGCSRCRNGNPYFCQACRDPLVSLIQGKCRCTHGYTASGCVALPSAYLVSPICSYIDVLGCLYCSIGNKTQCVKCIDPAHTKLANSSCSCLTDGHAISSEGNCERCQVEGCRSCVENMPTRCWSCIDSSASVTVDEICLCPNNQQMGLDGLCIPCQVPNCDRCGNYSGLICSKCSVLDAVPSADGSACVCRLGYRFNSQGLCILCNQVGGCSICNQANICSQCLPTFSLIEGICVCQQGYVSYKNETCVPCSLGCAICHFLPDNTTTCDRCIDRDDTEIINGSCVCLNTTVYSIDSSGNCAYCDVLGCEVCLAGTSERCFACLDPNATLLNGTCICKQPDQINVEGYCEDCNVIGCKICITNDTCSQCLDQQLASLTADEQCLCPKYKGFNNTGFCQDCPTGCNNCSLINTCNACDDQFESKLVSGRVCDCPSGKKWFKLVNGSYDCVHAKQVSFQLLLDTNISQFKSVQGDFNTEILRLAGIRQPHTPDNLVVSRLEQGSVKYEGSLPLETTNQAESAYDSLSRNMKANDTIAGIPVISSKISRSGFSQPTPKQKAKPNLLPLWIILPIIIILLIILVICCCQPKKVPVKDPSEKDAVPYRPETAPTYADNHSDQPKRQSYRGSSVQRQVYYHPEPTYEPEPEFYEDDAQDKDYVGADDPPDDELPEFMSESSGGYVDSMDRMSPYI